MPRGTCSFVLYLTACNDDTSCVHCRLAAFIVALLKGIAVLERRPKSISHRVGNFTGPRFVICNNLAPLIPHQRFNDVTLFAYDDCILQLTLPHRYSQPRIWTTAGVNQLLDTANGYGRSSIKHFSSLSFIIFRNVLIQWLRDSFVGARFFFYCVCFTASERTTYNR